MAAQCPGWFIIPLETGEHFTAACEEGSAKPILVPEQMKVRRLYFRFVLAALALAASSLWAQDGLGGAMSRLGATSSLLREPLEQRVVAADFDQDQKPDGAVLLDTGQFRGQKSYRIELHVSTHKNSDFTFESDEPALAITSSDVNQDGAPDIIVEQPFTHERLQVWLNDGTGSFHRARIEDLPSAGRESPYQAKAPCIGQDCPALELTYRLGSELAVVKVVARSFDSSKSGRHTLPIHSAAFTRADEPNPSRGPPSLLSL